MVFRDIFWFRCLNQVSAGCRVQRNATILDGALVFTQVAEGVASSNKLYNLFAIPGGSVSIGDKCISRKTNIQDDLKNKISKKRKSWSFASKFTRARGNLENAKLLYFTGF